MATNYAYRVNAPIGTTGQVAVTATATSTASAIQISAVRAWFVSDVDCYIRFGATAGMTAPTTANSMWIPASAPHIIDFNHGATAPGSLVTYVKVLRKGSTSGKIAYAAVA